MLLALAVWIAWGNTALELNTFTVGSSSLPEAFDGYRIAQISDLHNAQIGEDNAKLLRMLRTAEPDLIVMTGDLIDSRNTDVAVALRFVRQAVKIAPCCYVTGNHEARVSAYAGLKAGMETAGVTVLEDARTEIRLGSDTVTLIGVNDPSFRTDYLFGDAQTVIGNILAQLRTEGDGFTILLSHRPELFDTYVQHGVDLVFSGHAHGGQVRLPIVGGVIAPNQGLFPLYDAGLYTCGDTHMLVSRGIGNSLMPFRVNNRPEILLVELQTGREDRTE